LITVTRLPRRCAANPVRQREAETPCLYAGAAVPGDAIGFIVWVFIRSIAFLFWCLRARAPGVIRPLVQQVSEHGR
jgi:hypothetical protein